MVEQAEYVLRDLDFRDVRVRRHEMTSKLNLLDPKAPGSAGQAAVPESAGLAAPRLWRLCFTQKPWKATDGTDDTEKGKSSVHLRESASSADTPSGSLPS
jgi:hypothetical protein